MNQAFIGIGSNIEPRATYLNTAQKRLSQHDKVTIIAKSSIYETAPVGLLEQSHFLNMVIEVKTTLTSLELLRYCQEIELALGRKRTVKDGPRTLDLDILVYNQEYINEQDLILPHPRLHERAFVLVPFAEIAPQIILPHKGISIKELLKKLPADEVKDVVKWTEATTIN